MSDAPSPLARAFQRLLGQEIAVVSDHELLSVDAERDEELFARLLARVRELPATAEIVADIANRQERVDRAKQRQDRRSIIATLERWQKADRQRLDLARWRDRYLAERRPEDCQPWCLGLGARRRSDMLASEGFGGGVTFADRVEYCPCPDGDAARLRHEDQRRRDDAARRQATVGRIWETAEIPAKLQRYTLESYLTLPGANAALVEKLRRCLAVERAWLLLFGAAGTCKTGLSIALMVAAMAAGKSGLYVVVPDFLERLRATYGGDGGPGELAVMASAAEVDVLLLDDVGKASLSPWGREKLFTLVNRRDAQERRTIVTTNLSLPELEQHLGSPTFDRLRGNACDPSTGESFAIELTGDSRRGLAS